RSSDQRRVRRDALTVHTHAAGWRLLTDTPVTEHRVRSAIPEEQEDSHAGADDPLLEQDRERRGRQPLELRAKFPVIAGVRNHRLLPPVGVARNRAPRLHHDWVADGIRIQGIDFPGGGQEPLLRYLDPERARGLQHAWLVTHAVERGFIGERNAHVAEPFAVRQDGEYGG